MASRLPVPGLGPDVSTSTLMSTSSNGVGCGRGPDSVTRPMVGHGPRDRCARGAVAPWRRGVSCAARDRSGRQPVPWRWWPAWPAWPSGSRRVPGWPWCVAASLPLHVGAPPSGDIRWRLGISNFMGNHYQTPGIPWLTRCMTVGRETAPGGGTLAVHVWHQDPDRRRRQRACIPDRGSHPDGPAGRRPHPAAARRRPVHQGVHQRPGEGPRQAVDGRPRLHRGSPGHARLAVPVRGHPLEPRGGRPAAGVGSLGRGGGRLSEPAGAAPSNGPDGPMRCWASSSRSAASIMAAKPSGRPSRRWSC